MGLTEPGCPRSARALRTPCPDRALRGRGTLRGVESVSSVPSRPHQLLPPLEFCSALSVPGSLSPAQALSLLHPRRESACRPWPVTDRGQPPLPKAGPGRPGGDRAAVPPCVSRRRASAPQVSAAAGPGGGAGAEPGAREGAAGPGLAAPLRPRREGPLPAVGGAGAGPGHGQGAGECTPGVPQGARHCSRSPHPHPPV